MKVPEGRVTNEEDIERAEAYTLIGHLFKAPPTGDVLEMLGDFAGDDTPIGQAVADVATAARTVPPADIDNEFTGLFVNLVERAEVSPYASVQRTGSLFGQSLVELREDLRTLGVERRDDVNEPEDHVSALCEVMAGLLTGRLGNGVSEEVVAAFHRAHIGPWMASFAKAVETADGVKFYAAVARFSRLFLEREIARYG